MYNRLIKTIAVGSEPIKNPLMTAVAGAWFYMDYMIITLVALLTLDVGAWGTREVKTDTSGDKTSTLLTETKQHSSHARPQIFAVREIEQRFSRQS